MNAIAQWRLKAKVTQGFVAKKLGVSRTTVTKWESGASFPRAVLLPRLASLYGCTVDELLSEEAKEHDATS